MFVVSLVGAAIKNVQFSNLISTNIKGRDIEVYEKTNSTQWFPKGLLSSGVDKMVISILKFLFLVQFFNEVANIFNYL